MTAFFLDGPQAGTMRALPHAWPECRFQIAVLAASGLKEELLRPKVLEVIYYAVARGRQTILYSMERDDMKALGNWFLEGPEVL